MDEATLIEIGVASEETMGLPVATECETVSDPVGTGSITQYCIPT